MPGEDGHKSRPAPAVVVEGSVQIDRPAEEVFDYCTDMAHEPEWNPRTRYAEKLTDGPVRAGSRFRTEWLRGDPMVVEYVAFDRPHSWTATGLSRRLHTIGEGAVVATPRGARLDLRMVLQPRGMLRLSAPFLGGVMRRREQQNLAALKAALEDRPRS